MAIVKYFFNNELDDALIERELEHGSIFLEFDNVVDMLCVILLMEGYFEGNHCIQWVDLRYVQIGKFVLFKDLARGQNYLR